MDIKEVGKAMQDIEYALFSITSKDDFDMDEIKDAHAKAQQIMGQFLKPLGAFDNSAENDEPGSELYQCIDNNGNEETLTYGKVYQGWDNNGETVVILDDTGERNVYLVEAFAWLGRNNTLSITIDVTVMDEDIDDIMCTALEGGITHWCAEAEVVGDYLGEYASEQISRGGVLKLHDAEGEDVYELDKAKFLKGLKEYIRYNSYAVMDTEGRIDAGNIDAEAADEIIQYAVFGDVIFG